MLNVNPWKFGAVLALTVGIGYVVCTVVWISFIDQSLVFLNALFHGLDFRKLQVGGGPSLGAATYAFVVLVVWAYLIGALFAVVSNRLLVDRTGK